MARQRLLGVPAGDQRHHPATVRCGAGDLGAGDERQGLRGEVGILGLVGVRVVDPGVVDVEEQLVGVRHRIGHVGELQYLRSTELPNDHGAHGGTLRRRRVRTPHVRR